MQAHRLPHRRGWFWIFEGFRLYRRNPSLLGFLVFGGFKSEVQQCYDVIVADS